MYENYIVIHILFCMFFVTILTIGKKITMLYILKLIYLFFHVRSSSNIHLRKRSLVAYEYNM